MHKKITCCNWDKWVEYCAPFMNAPSPPPLTPSPGGDAKDEVSSESGSDIPPGPPTTNPFAAPFTRGSAEKDMYGAITAALNGSNLCPDYVFVSTPHKPDESDSSNQAVDCGMYPRTHAPTLDPDDSNTSGFGRVAWSRMEIAIECKTHRTDGDPFDERLENNEPNAEGRREVLGQVLSYAELVFKYQHRTYIFMILFLGDYFRLVRIDHSGLFATEQINYKEDGVKLAHFLWHYSRLCSACRGHDVTAERLAPDSDEAKRMRARVAHVATDDYISEMFKKSLEPQWPWWRLEVRDESRATPASRYFLVGKPHFQAPGVAGRATRGYVALEDKKEDAQFFYLKDAWRVDHDEIQKEGEVLKFLQEKNVAYVPTPVCHGDLIGQVTLSQDLWPIFHGTEKKCPLKRHQHYRLVVEEVGKPLEEFSRGWQLVFALQCSLIAHKEAYAADLLHRDISEGNILIHRKNGAWRGLLNDWELSKSLKTQKEEGRQPDRTGTWQFMSASALNDHCKPIVIQDELESHFHVLLYDAIRFLPHNCSNVPQFMQDYFDGYTPNNGVYLCGTMKQSVMREGEIVLASYVDDKEKQKEGNQAPRLRFYWDKERTDRERDHPINHLISTFLSWFRAHYLLRVLGPEEQKASATEERDAEPDLPAEEMAALLEARARLQPTEEPKPSPPDNGDAGRVSSKESLKQLTKKELEELAQNLETHAPMLAEIDKALDRPWPVNDKCDDRKPKKWKRQAGRVSQGSKIPTSRKHGLEHAAEDLPSTPSKKSRH